MNMEIPDDVKLAKGMLFCTYKKWLDLKARHQDFFHQVYEVRSSDPLPTKTVRRPIDMCLEYYEIYYVCKFGLCRGTTQATGLRQSR